MATTQIQARSHNGKQNTICGMLRDLFDSAEGTITSKHLPEIAEQTGFNLITVRLQFYRWRAEAKTAAAARARKGGTRQTRA